MMKSRNLLRAAAGVIALSAATVFAQAAAKPVPDRETLERKLASTATLIESSSAAQQIEKSGSPQAAEQRKRARELHRQAGDALKAGQLEMTARLLDDASRTMFDGVKVAAPEQVGADKQRADFDARLASTRALLDAQKRIAAEKNAPRAGEVSQRVETLIAQANDQLRAGKVLEARGTLDQGYLMVKAAIANLRNGDTVVRSLNFASKAEEYTYELDRNDTHRMLVQMLLKEKRGTAGVDAMVDQAVAAAAKLRSDAEQQAARRDHEAAVQTLEQSTRELVKAIRAAGVYIPG